MDIDEHTHGRSGRPGARPRNEIGYHAVRAGDNPGEHTIIFGMLGETLELRVAAIEPRLLRARRAARRRMARRQAAGAVWHERCAGTVSRELSA